MRGDVIGKALDGDVHCLAEMIDNTTAKSPSGKKLVLSKWVKTNQKMRDDCLYLALNLIQAGYESHGAAYLRMTFFDEEE